MRNPESGFTPERKKGLALALGILIGAGVAIDKCVDKLTDPGSVEPAKKEVRLTPEEVKSLRIHYKYNNEKNIYSDFFCIIFHFFIRPN